MLTLFHHLAAYSFSPIIHRAFGNQLGEQITYSLTDVSPGTLMQAVHAFREQGGIGANVTMPLKEEAFGICKNLTPRAAAVKSVNTLFWQDNALWGDNTDGAGLQWDLKRLGVTGFNQVIAVLGAGGAARGIIPTLVSLNPKQIWICNRTLSRATELAAHFEPHQHLMPLTYESLNGLQQVPDWFIVARPSFIPSGDISPHLVHHANIYELGYAKGMEPLPFSRWAKQQGAQRVFDGLGMLVAQAHASFLTWFPGAILDVHAVLNQLAASRGLN